MKAEETAAQEAHLRLKAEETAAQEAHLRLKAEEKATQAEERVAQLLREVEALRDRPK